MICGQNLHKYARKVIQVCVTKTKLYDADALFVFIPHLLSLIYSCVVRAYGIATEPVCVAAEAMPSLPINVCPAWACRGWTFCLEQGLKQLVYICPLIFIASVAPCARMN